jgi:hypothetical protein
MVRTFSFLCLPFAQLLQAQVHEIGYAECSKSHVLRGGKEYTPKQIQDMLGLSAQRSALRTEQPLGPANLLYAPTNVWRCSPPSFRLPMRVQAQGYP